MDKPNVFVVMFAAGRYEDHYTRVQCVHTSQCAAQQSINEKNRDVLTLRGVIVASETLHEDWMKSHPSPGWREVDNTLYEEWMGLCAAESDRIDKILGIEAACAKLDIGRHDIESASYYIVEVPCK